jgi:hypothetical protein
MNDDTLEKQREREREISMYCEWIQTVYEWDHSLHNLIISTTVSSSPQTKNVIVIIHMIIGLETKHCIHQIEDVEHKN